VALGEPPIPVVVAVIEAIDGVGEDLRAPMRRGLCDKQADERGTDTAARHVWTHRHPHERQLSVVIGRPHDEAGAVHGRRRRVGVDRDPGIELDVVVRLADHPGEDFEGPDRSVHVLEQQRLA
jgi:hypothetical protein